MKQIYAGAFALCLATAANADTPAAPIAAPTAATPAPGAGGILNLGDLPFDVTFNSDEQTATFTGDFKLFDGAITLGDDIMGREDRLTVKLMTPLAQGDDFVNQVNLDGLLKATSLSVDYSLVAGGNVLKHVSKPPPGLETVGTWIVTFNGKVGTQHHDYFDPVTLAALQTDTTPWQVGGKVGYVFASGNAALNLTYDYQEFFQDGIGGQTSTQCITTGNCVTGFIGAPQMMHKSLITGDFRWIGDINNHHVGVDLSLTYDPVADAESVQIPFYLMADDTGALTGGIRYNWNSDSHVSTIGVFASTKFSIL